MRPGLSHHTTNVEVVAERENAVKVRTKYFRLGPQGAAIGQYVDLVVGAPQEWRIRRRAVIAHGA